MRRSLKYILRWLGFLFLALQADAYNIDGHRWPLGDVPIHLQLGINITPLSDGASSFGAVTESAMAEWNAQLTNLRMVPVRNSAEPITRGNRTSNVFFSSTVYGSAWDSRTLAVTLSSYNTQTNLRTESDIIFNSGRNWDSYRGTLRTAANGERVQDFRRVALHELGHALGLDHPDDIGQNVSAVMNSTSSAVDALTADDIAGVKAIYDRAVATSQPGIYGLSGYAVSSGTLNLSSDLIRNVGEAASRALRLELWATPVRYTDSLPPGSHRLGSHDLPAVPSQGQITNISATVPYTAPPAGSYFIVMLLTEAPAVGSVYTIRDFLVFTNLFNTGGVAPTAPAITTQPVNLTVGVGASASFTVAATGSNPLTYQWRKNGTAISGKSEASLTIANAQAADSGTYSVAVSNSAGSVVSNGATLTVTAAPTIATHPQNAAVGRGSAVSISVVAAGSPPLSYQWLKAGVAVAGATTASLSFPNFQPADAGTYTVRVSNTLGSVVSSPAVLSIAEPPAIVTQPANVSVRLGASATFSVEATGTPLSYQWLRNGQPIAGATSATFTLPVTVQSDGGNYSVVVSNSLGSVTSRGVSLGLRSARLTNVSVRSAAGTGAQTLIVGFNISGVGTKNVLLRGVGPTLGAFGVTGAVSDPQVGLFNSTGVRINQNDDWGGSGALANAFASVGAFALPTVSRDSALLVPLPPGTYSVQLTPASTAGIALVEGYDTDAATTDTFFTNLSVRSVAGAGSDTLIVGFAISGTGGRSILFRAVGPTLGTFGVTGTLADPQLKLFNSQGVQINENNDWGGNGALAAVFSTIGAFALPANSRDAVLLLPVQPGAYTVQVSGVGNATGVALMELYELP